MNGHCFDIAKEGYVNLLPANKKHSDNPGDSKYGMTEEQLVKQVEKDYALFFHII